MSWNVRYFGHGLKGLGATEGWIHKLADTLAQQDPIPHVMALQEVEDRSLRAGLRAGNSQVQRFADRLHDALLQRGHDVSYQVVYFPAHRYQLSGRVPALYTTGLAVLVHQDLLVEAHNADEPDDITHVRMPTFRRWKQKRIAAHVRLRPRWGGPSFDLFNTHLSLPAFFEVGLHRIHSLMGHGSNQVQEIERLLSVIEARREAEHAIVVGDFNSKKDSPAWARLAQAGFVDAFHDFMDEELLENWHTAAFANLRMHIDHVFSTPGVQWNGFEEHTMDLGPFAGLSDHAPKVGSLLLG